MAPSTPSDSVPTDHQIIRALSRTAHSPPQQQPSHPSYAEEKETEKEGDKERPSASSRAPPKRLISNLRSKFIRSITPHPSLPPAQSTVTAAETSPIYQLNDNPTPPAGWSSNLARQKNVPIRSNSISSVYPRHRNPQQNSKLAAHQQPISTSSTDSLNTHGSNPNNPLRSKLERKFTQLSNRLNTTIMSHRIHKKSQSQSNLHQMYSCPNQNSVDHHHAKLKSSSSSSLSSFFDQSIIRALHHHPNARSEAETQKQKTPPSPKPILKSPSLKLPSPSPAMRNPTPAEHDRRIVTDHTSQQDSAARLVRNTSKRDQEPRKRTPHTIYLPIEHDPITGFVPNLATHHPKPSMISAKTNNNKLDNRQSPTQIALSRLDEILRGHHRTESSNATSDHTDLSSYYGYQPITNPNTNNLRSNAFSPIIDVSVTHSLSPPLRSRKKNNQLPHQPKLSHQHSRSFNDQHVLISPETWKSISLSTSKFHNHPLRTLE